MWVKWGKNISKCLMWVRWPVICFGRGKSGLGYIVNMWLSAFWSSWQLSFIEKVKNIFFKKDMNVLYCDVWTGVRRPVKVYDWKASVGKRPSAHHDDTHSLVCLRSAWLYKSMQALQKHTWKHLKKKFYIQKCLLTRYI